MGFPVRPVIENQIRNPLGNGAAWSKIESAGRLHGIGLPVAPPAIVWIKNEEDPHIMDAAGTANVSDPTIQRIEILGNL